ncbi:hypothetical protein [Bradyrhizobium sp. CCBAU 25338]|uniref:hypothetical protein n=1 Tax=Bradyrhizobium sp. CCBAU 25338 TaxID=1641877 RepID=UPI002303F5BB|nr:hypothetical protein [Bradyrhizobium sp. CCBAU 25338]MDA9532815.1 hypothetical protein [Bradyrhizobium sp. CCBAU 25338]
MRRDRLIGFQDVARVLDKSLAYTYRLSSADPAFPPVEARDGARKLFARHTVRYYKRNCRRWYRRHKGIE